MRTLSEFIHDQWHGKLITKLFVKRIIERITELMPEGHYYFRCPCG
ncbi:Hypothetical protein SLIV_20547 [Streptomyces lividans TK24]|uniref:Uncharacterized protein n=1 Tax=Streptomyces lividans TK24 TaxID=457428 RepID=A0ABX6TP84_STRLI|nr:Hypothetical protein SLIV_20547 [Streptomyces lividans TK24]QSJ10614.1 Hypothetical protein SLIVDG2_20547 [Streptomyces lividans]QTD71524.1 Hypothetical protein SLIVYQS_20547 [Streptomyces lividans TK24] [Streptomyces lividans]